ncbi:MULTISPECIES: maleylpyruvate isomerase N-terminal domain-containing protein [unclassified Isoptericola]|uniref:maleylpyruvate isomerase N-terminal domain-containing protein n=1 Tax=unclassified Isoptericola TaxID=2623355 RepID=UPI0036566E3C
MSPLTSPGAVRAPYLEAAARAAALLHDPRVAGAWDEGSILDGMTLGALAGHLARSILQVEWFLDGPLGQGIEPTTAVTYYARIVDAPDPGSALNRGVRARSQESALAGAGAVASDTAEALDRLRARLPQEPADRRVAILHRPGEEMLLDEYLRTRCVELAVHTDDLALSVGADMRAPDAATGVAIDLLVAAGAERHGRLAVLRALTRRERDDVGALRVL